MSAVDKLQTSNYCDNSAAEEPRSRTDSFIQYYKTKRRFEGRTII